MTKTERASRIVALEAEQKRLSEAQHAIRVEMDAIRLEEAKEKAIFKVGDMVEWVVSKGYQQGERKAKGRIVRIGCSSWSTDPVYYAIRILKDGSEGHEKRLDSWGHPVKI